MVELGRQDHLVRSADAAQPGVLDRGRRMATGRKIRYHVERDWWSVHFNSSRDNTLFAGDGGDASQVAYSTDGMWINLFRVQPGDG